MNKESTLGDLTEYICKELEDICGEENAPTGEECHMLAKALLADFTIKEKS